MDAWSLDVSRFEKIAPPCPYVGKCGGCRLQDLAYPDQLEAKTVPLREALRTLAPDVPLDVTPAPDPWRYRNKAEMSFSSDGGVLTLGYHAARSFWRVVDIGDCLLLPLPLNAMAATVRHAARDTGQPAYHTRSHQGFFRHLILRHSRSTGQALACLVTAPGPREAVERIAEELMARHPELAGVYWGVTARTADVALPEELTLLRGAPSVMERVGGFTLELLPLNFLQPNLAQAERLYETVVEWLTPAPQGAAWDMYCGIGTVGFYLSRRFGRVYGIESEASNLQAARRNAEANGITNISFHAGKTEAVLTDKRFWFLEAKPEAVVVDPPRAGLHEQVIGALLGARPRQLVYISCNPQALVRDLRVLLRGFPRYTIRRAAAFDLFPQTPHIETAVLLER